MDSKNLRAYFAWIAVCIIWGTTYLAIRIGVEHIPPMLFAGIRWIIAGIIFILILRLKGKKLPSKNDLIHIAVVGISLIGIGNGLVVTGEQFIGSGLAALLITTVPFWVVGMEAVIPSGPKINLVTLSGLIVGLIGVILIFNGDWSNLLNPSYLSGVLCILGAVIAWSFGTVYSKYKKIGAHPLMGAAVQMLIAGVAQTFLGLFLGEASYVSFHPEGIASIFYLIIAGSIFGYGSYIYAIEHLPLSLVATYAYINPVIALFLGWLVLNETMNLTIIVAAVIIILGVILVKQGAKRQKLFMKKSVDTG
ncbi:MAG TPA: EamA family transporter [Ignavibacteriaceae bacterium]|nr:EamA family transporter [Ignavibacteriaceae bacterium]